jgi:hypothetical protein
VNIEQMMTALDPFLVGFLMLAIAAVLMLRWVRRA